MNVYVYVYIDSLACRSVIELLEMKLSRLKQKQHTLSRRDTWTDMLASDARLLQTLVLLIERGDMEQAEATIAKKEGERLVIHCIADIYRKTSRTIHEAQYNVVPIKLGQLADVQAAVMMELCRQYPVEYGLYDVSGVRINAPGTPLEFVRRGREGFADLDAAADDDDDDDKV